MNIFLQGAALAVGFMVCAALVLATTGDDEGIERDDFRADISGWWIAPGLMAGVLLLIGLLVEVAL